MTTKTIRHYRKMFEDLGVKFTERHTGSGHLRYSVIHAGKTANFIFASSPSDHRVMRNNRAAVSRFIRQAEA